MSDNTPVPPPDDPRAARRFAMLGAARIGSLLVLLAGIAISQAVIEAPYALGVVLAIGGMLGFFFGPYLLARRWRSEDSKEGPE